MTRRILVVAHNHPDLHPGGTEIFAHDLASAYRSEGCEVLFLGATNAIHPDMTKSLKPASVTVGKSGVLASL